MFPNATNRNAIQVIAIMFFGDHPVDILQVFAPMARAKLDDDTSSRVYIIACIITQDELLGGQSAPLSKVNHFLGASALAGTEGPLYDVELSDLVVLEDRVLVEARDTAPLREHYRNLGYVVHLTASQGDCGPDSAACVTGRPRSPVEWKALRLEVSRAMVDWQGDEDWQACYIACQEFNIGGSAVSDQGDSVSDQGDSVSDQGNAVSDQGNAVSDQGDASGHADAFAMAVGPVKTEVAEQLLAMFQPEAADALRKDIKLARTLALKGSKGAPQKHRGEVRQFLTVRLAIGSAFNDHKQQCVEEGQRNYVKTFHGKVFNCVWNAQVRCRIIRCGELAKNHSGSWHGTGLHGQRKSSSRMRPLECRKNIISSAGRPVKAVAVREALFAWFVDMRGSVKGRFPQKLVMLQATFLVEQYVRAMISLNKVPKPPKLDYGWFRRWKRAYGVSFRSPNKRFKLSRKGVLVRLEIFWLNNIRVRYFATKVLGIDPGEHADGADQKGWHINQAGSRQMGTLELAGTTQVELKENHADTRGRLSLMTYTSNNVARIARGLPLEICFKFEGVGGGKHVLPKLNLPPGPFSLRASDSGSYQEQHVYLYLELHLEIATAERRKANDWRLFYLDIYAGHLSLRIFMLCWSRMYILLFHGGGLTGMTQCNDVWLHWVLERKLLAMEQLDHCMQALLRPNVLPSISRQTIVNNSTSVWAHEIEHARTVKCSKRTGVSIALNGDEDCYFMYSTVTLCSDVLFALGLSFEWTAAAACTLQYIILLFF